MKLILIAISDSTLCLFSILLQQMGRSLHQPSFVLTAAFLCLSPFFCWSLFIYPHLIVLVGLASIHVHCHSFVCACLCGPCLSPLGCTGWSSCLSPFVHVLHYILVSICLLASVCPCPFASTWLCWFLFGCAYLAFTHAH